MTVKLHRFFCENIASETITLDAEESHHLRVLRLDREGQEVEIFDGAGNHRTTEVLRAQKGKNVTLAALTPLQKDSPLEPRITLAISLPKGERQDTIVQMCQELALSKLIPMICERSLPGELRMRGRLTRWRRIAISAAKQSDVNFLTEITAPLAFSRVIEMGKDFSLSLIFTPSEAAPLIQVLRDRVGLSSILVLIGPEGDFTDGELEETQDRGFISVSMPLPVLRIETAAISALTLLRALAK
jgi:16S rRNA (uracil1498-N3)-methyltransferase